MNILLIGGSGRMGCQVKNLKCNHKIITFDICGDCDYNDFDKIKEDIDVVLDFSSPLALEEVAEFCQKQNIPLVSAVTGYDESQMKMLDKLALTVPVIHSGNFSLGVNVVNKILAFLAQSLSNAEIEICETHHIHKKDAPSGTAKMFLDTLEKNSNTFIRVHSLRGGEVKGEHSVIFFCGGERIEIKHIADSREIFASGAIKACEWIVGKKAGLYNMEDVISE